MNVAQPNRRYEDTLAQLHDWRERFINSEAFSRLTPIQQASAGCIIEAFAENAYAFLGSSPDNWGTECVQECCSEILPRKVAKGAWFFESVCPVLKSFFIFLAEHRLLVQGRLLAVAINEVHVATIVNAENPFRWGPAKMFAMAAREAGVDLAEPSSLTGWCQQMNLRRLEELN